MYEDPVLYMVLNSSMSTNLYAKISGALQQSPIGMQEAMLLYASENKIKAMEDCIEFSGKLFRVQKSIIVSEPLIPFPELLRMKVDMQGRYKESDPTDDSASDGAFGDLPSYRRKNTSGTAGSKSLKGSTTKQLTVAEQTR